jgi:hypothetical protein
MQLKPKTLVPKGGLEPPHPCEYMDLNHARLPIPPLRHGAIRPANRQPEHAYRELLVLQTEALLSIPARHCRNLLGGVRTVRWKRAETVSQRARLLGEKSVYLLRKVTFSHMTEQNNHLSQVPSNDEIIPEDLSVEMRRIAHDLSNALEIIIQTSYLLNTVELKGPASDWLRMLDDGVQKALALNLELRTYIKDHTSS